MTKTNDNAATSGRSDQFQSAATQVAPKPANKPAAEVKRTPVAVDRRWDVC